MKNVSELLASDINIKAFGDVGVCEVEGCWTTAENYIALSMTIDGKEHLQVNPVFLCKVHFREFTRLLSYGPKPTAKENPQ